jgi:pimeloyl-ACP methyl ester carboxylesterase
MEKKKVYFISGLGADSTVFDQLDLSFCEPVFLDWITPLKKESLEHYALRLAESIREPDATIVGLSMGGMMATEIVKAHPRMKAIIISSNKSSTEFPAFTRFSIRYFPLYQLTTKWILRLIFPLTCWFLGANEQDKKHLWKMIERRDMAFIKWCIWAIGRWRSDSPRPNVVHVHGTADKLLPIRYVHPEHRVNGGTHLMIRNRAKEIAGLLQSLIA